jgi:hypothetical protein
MYVLLGFHNKIKDIYNKKYKIQNTESVTKLKGYWTLCYYFENAYFYAYRIVFD